jgi:hypothetical protein
VRRPYSIVSHVGTELHRRGTGYAVVLGIHTKSCHSCDACSLVSPVVQVGAVTADTPVSILPDADSVSHEVHGRTLPARYDIWLDGTHIAVTAKTATEIQASLLKSSGKNIDLVTMPGCLAMIIANGI